MSANWINDLIHNRRSVFSKQFAINTPVDDAVVQQMLENANWAPTHKLTEPWRFKVYSGSGLEVFTHTHVKAYEALAGERFSEAKLEKIKQPLTCSHIIVVAMKRHESVPYIEEVAAVACAVQNMHLTAQAYGIGAYWSTGGVCLWEGAAQEFGFDAGHQLLGFFYVGNIAIPSPTGKRSPVSEKVVWIK